MMPEYYNDHRYRQKSDIPYEKCGVADLDQSMSPVNGMPSPSAAFRPVSTNKTYDYAEYGSHQYEELPHSRLQPSGSQMSPGSTDSRSSDNQSSAGTTITSSDVPSDAGDTANIVRSQSQKDEEQRKRYNPLYDTMINTTPNIYNKVRVTRESVLQSQIKVLKIFVIILIFISCISLSISLYLIVANSSDSSVQNLKKEISSIENKYTDLEARIKQVESLMSGNLSFEHLAKLGQKVLDIETSLTSNLSAIDRKIEFTNNKIDVNQGNIHAVYQNYTTSLSVMNQTVQYQLDTISKMPGPQGPQGVGNLSACSIKEYSTGSAAAELTTTISAPTENETKNDVIMSAYCSVENGLHTRMELQKGSDSRTIKYKCICSGQVQGQQIRRCYLNLWLCPRDSFGGQG